MKNFKIITKQGGYLIPINPSLVEATDVLWPGCTGRAHAQQHINRNVKEFEDGAIWQNVLTTCLLSWVPGLVNNGLTELRIETRPNG